MSPTQALSSHSAAVNTWCNPYSTAQTSGGGQQYFVPQKTSKYYVNKVAFTIEQLKSAHQITLDRLTRYPSSPFFSFADKELKRLDARLAERLAFDRAFYESLIHGIGLKCTRELDASDPEFCSKIDDLLEQVQLFVT